MPLLGDGLIKRRGGGALLASLVSFWELGEASGTRNDSFGTNHLTSNNTVGQATGKVGNAAQFNAASTRYLSITDNASLSAGNIDLTLCAWVYLDSVTGGSAGRTIFSKYTTSGNQREHSLLYNLTDTSPNNRFAWTVSSNGTATTTLTATTFGAASISTWYFVVVWHDSVADTLNIQINNGTVDSVSYSSGIFDSTSAFAIGALFAPTSPFYLMDGRIDQVGFWKRVLNSTEKTFLYNSGNGRSYAEVAAH